MQIQFSKEEYMMICQAVQAYTINLEEDLIVKSDGAGPDPMVLHTCVQFKLLQEKLQSRT
jgi:hypothetical protein